MPKTFTDDVVPVLPTAIHGPFQVVVPGDVNSFFKIDPALARIEAAGIARPVRRLNVAATRTSGIAPFATLDSALDGRSLSATGDNGLYSIPFQVPPETDLAAASNLKVLAAPAADGGGGQVVRFEVVTAYGKDGDTSIVTETIIYDWTTPTGWSKQDIKSILIDAGGGYTYAGNKFEGADFVGVLVRRIGSAAQDTFSPALVMGTGLVFEYTANRI